LPPHMCFSIPGTIKVDRTCAPSSHGFKLNTSDEFSLAVLNVLLGLHIGARSVSRRGLLTGFLETACVISTSQVKQAEPLLSGAVWKTTSKETALQHLQ
jgi:hypothetical protein